MHWAIGEKEMALAIAAADAEPLEGRDLTTIRSPSIDGNSRLPRFSEFVRGVTALAGREEKRGGQ